MRLRLAGGIKMQLEIPKDTGRIIPGIRIICVVCSLPVGRVSAGYGKAMCWKCEKEIYEKSIERFQKARPVEIKKGMGQEKRNGNSNLYDNHTESLKLKNIKESKGWKKEMSDAVRKRIRKRYESTW